MMGIPLTLVEANLNWAVLDPASLARELSPDDVLPVSSYDGDGKVLALRVRRVTPASILAMLGLHEGDVITSVDGYDADVLLNRLAWGAPLCVLEILRGSQRVVLGVQAAAPSR
jgi:hypothetical protein